MSSTQQEYTTERMAELELMRRRYKETAYVFADVPLSAHPVGNLTQMEKTEATVVTTEETTAVTTVTTHQCCAAHGQGCAVDHGATRYGKTVVRRSGKVVQLPLIEDTGSGPNWLPQSLARELQCELRDAGPNAASYDFGGNVISAKKKATISLEGLGRRVDDVEFFIAPERFPLQCAILGRDFIKKTGHPNQRFPDRPDTVGIVVQAQVSASITMLPHGRMLTA
jgi:hypothetical protein